MSAYCQVVDVQNEIKGINFSANNAVITSTIVTAFIAEASALIDSFVGQRWVTPITGTQSLLLMSLYCRVLVVARVKGILRTQQATNKDGNTQINSDGSLSPKDVMNSLQMIADGRMQLSDSSLILNNAGFFSQNNSSGIQPVAKKSQQQW